MFWIPTLRAFETASPPTWTRDLPPPDGGNVTALAFAPGRRCEVYALATRQKRADDDPTAAVYLRNKDGSLSTITIPEQGGRKVTALQFEDTGPKGKIVLFATVTNYG